MTSTLLHLITYASFLTFVIAVAARYHKINSMMDHVWDGFYTGQTRLSRFPAMIEAD